MFPDSTIAKQFSLSHQKASYMISHGFRPYFQNNTVKDVLSSGVYFTIHFDETVTSQSKKQMDILIRYWLEQSACVQVRYLCSLFFGHAFAKFVCKGLLDVFQDLALPLNKLLSLSADGPNVNKSIKGSIDTAVKGAGAEGLVDVGFCFIHKIHNAFKAGNTAFGIHALDFAMNIFTWFHLYPARQEDFKFVQDDENLENLKFLRHVDSRWLSLLPAVERIHGQMSALKKYFTVFIPKHEKRSQQLKKFKDIHESLTKNEGIILVEMAFLESVKPLFDGFLTAFLVEGPLIHMLCPSLVNMLRQIMYRFIKPELVQGKNGTELAQTDVKKADNQLPDERLNIGVKAKDYLKNLSPLQKNECIVGMKLFFSKSTEYIQDRLPYRNTLLKALPCLHPDMRQQPSSDSKVATVAANLPCCEENELPLVVDEWKIYRELEIPQSWVTEKDKKGNEQPVRVDKYWANIFGLTTAAGRPRFTVLPKVVKCALTLSHGNADTERSLSQNKKILTKERTSMQKSTLIWVRLTKDAVGASGGQAVDVKITKELLSHCKSAHQEYKKFVTEQQRKEREEKQKKEKEHEKQRQAEEEEKATLEKVKSLKNENKDIDNKIEEAEGQLTRLDGLSVEANKRMTEAIKEKHMMGIEIAHELQEVAANKQKTAHAALHELNKRKREITDQLEKYAKKKRLV